MKLIAALLFVSACSFGQLTTIQDTLYQPNGTKYSGSLSIAVPIPFVGGDGRQITAGPAVTTQVINGALSVSLEANDTATPANTYYTVTYRPTGAAAVNEIWIVPYSASPIPLSAVRVSPPPPTPQSVGIVSIDALTNPNQFLAKVNDTNVTLDIASAVSTHTFTLGWTGTLANNRITHPNVTVNTTSPLTGGGTVALGDTITIGCSGCGAAGSAITDLTGDVTATGPGSVAATIASGAVSLAKMANLAANSIIGNNTGSPTTPIALTASQVNTLLGTVTGSGLTSGLPVIGAGSNAVAIGTRSGNTTKYITTTGAFATDDCAKFDPSGNVVSAGASCGTSGGGITALTGNVTASGSGSVTATVVGATPHADFLLTQNSVAALTSVESGAVANTLYLTGGKVGVGVVPTDTFDVSSSGTVFTRFASTGGSFLSIINNGASDDRLRWGNTNLYFEPNSAGNTPVQAMTITAAGAIGMGTTTPAYPIQATSVLPTWSGISGQISYSTVNVTRPGWSSGYQYAGPTVDGISSFILAPRAANPPSPTNVNAFTGGSVSASYSTPGVGFFASVWGDYGSDSVGSVTTTLTGNITTGSSTIPVATTTGMQSGSHVFYVLIDSEWISATGTSGGNTLTGLTRGLWGTTPASHSNGTTLHSSPAVAGAWGTNTISQLNSGSYPGDIYGAEYDFACGGPSHDYGPCQTVQGLLMIGVSTVAPLQSWGVKIEPLGGIFSGTVIPWQYAFWTDNGAATTGMNLGAALQTGPSDSQPIVLNSITSGSSARTLTQTLDAAGNFNVTPSNGVVSFGTNTQVLPDLTTGASIGWNRSAGQGEVNYYNNYYGAGNKGFVWSGMTGSGTYADVMELQQGLLTVQGGIAGTGLTISGSSLPVATFISTSAVSAGIMLQDGNGTPNQWQMLSGTGTTTDGNFGIRDARQNAIRMKIDTSGNVFFQGLTSTGSAGSKKVVCVDTVTGQLYASSTSTDCSN